MYNTLYMYMYHSTCIVHVHVHVYMCMCSSYVLHVSLTICLTVQDRVGRPTEGRQMGVVDPGSNMIALHLYCGMLKVVPLQLDSTEPLTAFNIRSGTAGQSGHSAMHV